MELDKYRKLDSKELENIRKQAKLQPQQALECLNDAHTLLDDGNNEYIPHDIAALKTALSKVISKVNALSK